MLKAILDKIDDEALKPFYAEKDGKFVLQVEGMVHDAEVNGLKTALVKERENNAAWKKFGTPDDVTRKIADLEEAVRKGNKSEDHQKIVDQMKADHARELQERDARYDNLLSQTASADLKAELAKQNVIPEGLDILANFATQRIKFNDDGSPKIMSEDGTMPMIGNGPNGGATLSDLAKELATKIPHLVKDPGAGGGGKPPGQNGGKPPQKTVDRSAFDAMSHAERSAFVNDGGTVVDA